MKIQVFAIKDRALDVFGQPIYAHTINQAIRGFKDGVNEPNTPMNKHPDDYDLFHLGEYDDNTGAFTNHTEGPQQVAIGKHLVDVTFAPEFRTVSK